MKYFIWRRRRLVPRRASAREREREMGRGVAPRHALAGEGVNERQIELPSHPSLTSARDGEGEITEREIGGAWSMEMRPEAAAKHVQSGKSEMISLELFSSVSQFAHSNDDVTAQSDPSVTIQSARLPPPAFRRRFPRLERPQISHRFSSSWSTSATLSCGLSQSVGRSVGRSVACTTE